MNKKKPTKSKPNVPLQLSFISAFSIFVFWISSRYDILEQIVIFSNKYEYLEIDEIFAVTTFLAFALSVVAYRHMLYIRMSEKELLSKNTLLTNALAEIKQLRGIIPICTSCKKIRDDIGLWHQVETYLTEHSDVLFSHALCPECLKKLYPDFADKE